MPLTFRMFVMSPLERSHSSARLKLSATGKLASGPVTTVALKTDEASSSSRERV